MKYTDEEIRKHIDFVSGYLDAVGRSYTTETVLFSMWAEEYSERINQRSVMQVSAEKKMDKYVHELEKQVSEFLNTDSRERLVFYLLEYLIWFKEYAENFECYRLKVEFDPNVQIYLGYKLVVNRSHVIYVFMTKSNKENA